MGIPTLQVLLMLKILNAEVNELYWDSYDNTIFCYVFCVRFSRIVSESKTLVNGIDTCVEQTASPDQNVGSNSFTEQSTSLCLPPAPVNSPAADSTEAAVSGSSWFAGLTTVVDSPNSYPKWRDSDTAVSSLCSVTSCGSNSTKSSSVIDPDVDDDDDDEPPAKRQVLELTLSPAPDDVVSTTAAAAPLLGQLLSSSEDFSERHSDDDGDDEEEAVDDSAADIHAHQGAHSSNSTDSPDVSCMSSDDSFSNVQHEGLSYLGSVMR